MKGSYILCCNIFSFFCFFSDSEHIT